MTQLEGQIEELQIRISELENENAAVRFIVFSEALMR